MLFSEDDAPYGLARKLRSWVSKKAAKSHAVRESEIHKGIQCIRCQSVWWGMVLAPYAIYRDSLPTWLTAVGDWVILFSALSAVAVILTRIPEKK